MNDTDRVGTSKAPLECTNWASLELQETRPACKNKLCELKLASSNILPVLNWQQSTQLLCAPQ